MDEKKIAMVIVWTIIAIATIMFMRTLLLNESINIMPGLEPIHYSFTYRMMSNM